ncbi:MAG: hypothetical protein IIU44_03815, partial [Spirochaetales bacterium]|nr:hypothetical protein [Spirochaetales bacterium]
MKRVARSAMCALMTMMLACAVLGSKDASFTVRAEELNNDPMMSTQGTDSDFENEDTLDVCFYIRGD